MAVTRQLPRKRIKQFHTHTSIVGTLLDVVLTFLSLIFWNLPFSLWIWTRPFIVNRGLIQWSITKWQAVIILMRWLIMRQLILDLHCLHRYLYRSTWLKGLSTLGSLSRDFRLSICIGNMYAARRTLGLLRRNLSMSPAEVTETDYKVPVRPVL